MPYHHFNPERVYDPLAIPNLEVFFAQEGELYGDDDGPLPRGWYWWACFPNCLPDSDPHGPFASEQAALEDAREY
jgi:hypothetical protein